MTLKLATEADFPAILDMAMKFAQASPYKDFPIEEEKVAALLQTLLHDKNKTIVVLYIQNDKPVGMIAGMISEMLFNREMVASELIWWVNPEVRSRKTLSLKEAYEYWAKRVGAKYIQMTNLNDDKITRYYERTGYVLTEKSFLKKVA